MRSFIVSRARSFSKEEKGATMFEYAILVGVVALVAIGGATIFGTDLRTMLENLATSVTKVNTTATTN
jgi:pilus assembly protein Flp/PilA